MRALIFFIKQANLFSRKKTAAKRIVSSWSGNFNVEIKPFVTFVLREIRANSGLVFDNNSNINPLLNK